MADHAAPVLHLHDGASMGKIEEQVGAGIPSNAEPGDAVSLLRKQVLEEEPELPAVHGVDGRHAGALIGLRLFRPSSTESRHAGQDERHKPEHEQTLAGRPHGRRTQDEQDRAGQGNHACWVAAQARLENLAPRGLPTLGLPTLGRSTLGLATRCARRPGRARWSRARSGTAR